MCVRARVCIYIYVSASLLGLKENMDLELIKKNDDDGKGKVDSLYLPDSR